ncbi:MAG: S41 family peptidase [Candidatus Dormibacteraeota bacterium]|nr:S41 family peptidase [Candidatus Dormibacteraeota bacterium]
MTGAPGAGHQPDEPVRWSGEAPPRRYRITRPSGRVSRTVAMVAACYLTALLVVNLSTSSYAGFINRIFPHIGGAPLDQTSIAAEWQVIQQNYVIRNLPPALGTQGAGQGMIQALHDTYNDRFSAYLSATQYQDLNSTLGGRRDGSIGIAVEPRCAGDAVCAAGQTADRAVIENVLVNQPADRAGVRRGDELVAVDGRPLASLGGDENMRIDRAASLVRGTVSSRVELTVQRGGTQLTLAATRENLQIPSVYSRLIGRVLYMQVTGFDTDTGAVTRTQLQRGIAGGATSIILDLRQNGGGYVSAAQSLVSEFVAPSTIHKYVVIRRGRLSANGDLNSAQEVSNDAIQAGGVALTQPMAVLVDGDSASAAEITAAALRDYHRATVVGDKTFGKGSVQVDFPLPDGADLHLTVERWYGPNGESIEGSGITPDRSVTLPSPDSRFQLDAQSAPASGDAQLQAALTALRAL